MQDSDPKKSSLSRLKTVKRKAINISQGELVKIGSLQAKKQLPIVIQPTVAEVDLVIWSKHNRVLIEENLRKYGGVLFRGFEIKSVSRFEDFVASLTSKIVTEHERSSPRSQILHNIYTSTDHPPDQKIFLHNEMSYSYTWPMKIYFCCIEASTQGGETPIADTREIFNLIPPDIRERFMRKKVMYVRNYGDGFGYSWQESFNTTDPAVVEEYCHKTGMQFEWKDQKRLRTRRIGSAIFRHPETKDLVWFNHATFFHVSTLEPEIRDALLTEFEDVEDIPTHSFYGDGSPIEPAVLDKLREVYEKATVSFPWQEGDILVLDNMLAAHGRNPFVGSRKVMVTMSDPITEDKVQLR